MSETSASNADPALPGDSKPPEVPKPPKAPKPPKPPKPAKGQPQAGPFQDAQERISDPERMKALAHPARMAVFDFLANRRVQGFDGATATEIAEVADMTPSAMSYHLRTLAKAGFIEEAPSRGDARERLWRLKIHSFSIEAEKDAPESDKVAERAMVEAFADQEERSFRRWVERKREDPKLQDLSTSSHGRLRLTPEEIVEFKDRFFELLHEYSQRSLGHIEKADADDGTVIIHYNFREYPDV